MVGSAWIGSVAKALAALVLTLVAGLLTDKGIIIEDQNTLSAAIEALVTAFLIWAVPNRPYPSTPVR